MNRKQILVVTGLVFAAFGLGVGVGWRLRPPVIRNSRSMFVPAARASDPFATPTGSSPTRCADVSDAGSLVGKSGCVSGQVLKVFTSRGGNTFLDFCPDYRSCPFTSVIFAADKDKFGNLQALQGVKVEVRGDIKNYRNSAEIIIHDPHQINAAP